jgi:hypothetical protein
MMMDISHALVLISADGHIFVCDPVKAVHPLAMLDKTAQQALSE